MQNTGFFGQGLGEAYVYLTHTGSKTWFFHNSYWSALVEGGWLWMILVVAITVLYIVNVFSGKKTLSAKFYVVQGAGVAIMICASRLGEVFYTWPWPAVWQFACWYWNANRVWAPAMMSRASKASTSELRFVMLKKPITT